MSVLVVYESRHGRARAVADAVADACAAHSIATLIRAVDEVTPFELAAAEVVIAGCWTMADVPFGGEPTQRVTSWIDGIPPLDGKPVGVFCTYSFFPHTFADVAARTAETLHELSRSFELKGGKVVATRSIHFTSIDQAAAGLVERVLAHLHG